MTNNVTSLLKAMCTCAGLMAFLVFANGSSANQQTTPSTASALELLYRQKYNEAVTQLEQVLEREPGNSEALTYMVTANLYKNRNFFRAQDEFKEAFKAGGGATFFVTHSHEMFTTSDVVNYCRGWLHLRKGSVEFSPIDGNHGFKTEVTQITDFAINKLSKKAFHIKAGGKNQNFRGRSNTDLEPLVIVALYKSFKST